MAEFAEFGDLMETIGESAEDTAADDVTDETAENELETEEEATQESKQSLEDMQKDLEDIKNSLNELSESTSGSTSKLGQLKSFGIFIAKNIAVGGILWGVMKGLDEIVKLAKKGSKEQTEALKMKNKLSKISEIIKQVTDEAKSLSKWLADNKKTMVKMEGVISIPLPQLFADKTQPLQEIGEKTYQDAKKLAVVDPNTGKITKYNTPTKAQLEGILDDLDQYLDVLKQFHDLTVQLRAKHPVLNSIPLTDADFVDLKNKVAAAKNLI